MREESFKYGIMKTNPFKVVKRVKMGAGKKELISPKQTAII